MTVYSVSQGGVVNAQDVTQFFSLLTGGMTDQQVTISNRIRAQLSGATGGAGGFVGQTTGGAPTTGTFVTGDWIVDTTGVVWTCTAGGTPGTWLRATPYRRVVAVTGAPVGAVTFSGIPTTLKMMRLTYAVKSDANTTTVNLYFQVNGNTGANYFYVHNRVINATQNITNVSADTRGFVGVFPAMPSGIGQWFGTGTVTWSGWDIAATDRISYTSHSGCYPDAVNTYLSSVYGMALIAPPWTSITMLPQSGNLAVGSEFVLEGWD